MSLTERQVLKNINANCNSPVSVYAKIIEINYKLNVIFLTMMVKKYFQKKISESKRKI